MEQIAGFPKNLAYNLKKLQGSIIKQKISINADKSSYKASERMIFNFPIGRAYDSRSVVLTAKCATDTNGNHFPRGGLNSLIENLQITANSKVLQSTQYYNYIWNTLADVSGYFSADQITKRIYENSDPSIKYTNVSGEGEVVSTLNTTVTDATESLYFSVNNWLGFLSSSASVLDTNNLGQLQMIITLAPQTCLWLGAPSGSAGLATSGNYTISDINLSMDTITFTNSMYQELVKSQLEAGGLNVAYHDYLVSVGSLSTKSTITHTAQFLTNSLDSVIYTTRNENYDKSTVLYLGSATVDYATTTNSRGSSNNFYLSSFNPEANEGRYGGFNNSGYFLRDGGGIDTTTWSVNSQPMTQNSTAVQIYNNVLQGLGYTNIDIASGGLHPGACSSGHYNKHYFLDMLSLENISGDNNNWVSGLSGNGGIIQVSINAKYLSGVNTQKVYPYLIGVVSKILNIKIGRNLDLME